jgi:hypothetical protein
MGEQSHPTPPNPPGTVPQAADRPASTKDGSTRARWSGRLPIGLVSSMLIISVCLAVMLICWNLQWPADNALALIAHTSAALCLGWGIVLQLTDRLGPRFSATRVGEDLASVIQTVQMLLGLVTTIICLYLAIMSVFTRIPSLPFFIYEPQMHVIIWPGGSVDIVLVGLAVVLAWRRTDNGVLMTCLLWLGVLASLWQSLQIPDVTIRAINGLDRVIWRDWVSPFALGASVTLGGLMCLAELRGHWRRVSAWPDRLDDLLLPPPAWSGFGYSAGIVAVIIMVLGCMMIVSPLTAVSALIAGTAMLALAHRRWEENYADAGLGLITLGAVSLLMLNVPERIANESEYFASIFSRALLGLAIMSLFWFWLAGVWEQQLDQGRAWTTAGRLIRPCRRVGFLIAATGALVSIHLAFWPKLPYVTAPDNSLGRWVWGIGPNLLLAAGTALVAIRVRRSTVAWLTVMTLCSTMAFTLLRVPNGRLYIAMMEYWPLAFTVAADLCLVAAALCWRSGIGKPFFEPLYLFGILLLPMIAISGASVLNTHAIPLWVDPATFGMLAGTYVLAAFIIGPRRLAILAAVCLLAAVARLRGL